MALSREMKLRWDTGRLRSICRQIGTGGVSGMLYIDIWGATTSNVAERLQSGRYHSLFRTLRLCEQTHA